AEGVRPDAIDGLAQKLAGLFRCFHRLIRGQPPSESALQQIIALVAGALGHDSGVGRQLLPLVFVQGVQRGRPHVPLKRLIQARPSSAELAREMPSRGHPIGMSASRLLASFNLWRSRIATGTGPNVAVRASGYPAARRSSGGGDYNCGARIKS